MDRSTKKVKTHEMVSDAFEMDMSQSHADDGHAMETTEFAKLKNVNGNKISYKDKVMYMGEDATKEWSGWEFTPEDIIHMAIEKNCPEINEEKDEPPPSLPFNPKPNSVVSAEEYGIWCKPWHNTLIVRLLGKKVGLKYMTNKLQNIWAKKGVVHVMDRSHDFFMVRFEDEGDCKHALFDGPWLVLDHYLLVQRWRPFFRPANTNVQKIAAWVRIPDLPCELCNDQFFWRVGALIGTMLKVDHNTSIHSRGKFARICIELDLRRELVPSFTVLGAQFNLEYEGLHLICFSCGKYGHKMEACPSTFSSPVSDGKEDASGTSGLPFKEREFAANSHYGANDVILNNQQSNVSLEESNPVIKDSCFGPWMLARRTFRKRGPISRIQGVNHISIRCSSCSRRAGHANYK